MAGTDSHIMMINALYSSYVYLGLVEPADGRSHSTYHLQNPVNGLAPFRVLVAQLVEHPPSDWKVMGSNPIGDSDFFRVYLCMFQLFL